MQAYRNSTRQTVVGDDPWMADMLTKNLAFLLRGDKSVQAATAAKAGVTQPTISKWARLHETNSESEPEFRDMARLCASLGVSLDALAFRDIEREGLGVSQPLRHEEGTMAQAVELLQLMADARPDDRRFSRPTWAMIKFAALAIEKAKGDQRKVMAEILAGLEAGV